MQGEVARGSCLKLLAALLLAVACSCFLVCAPCAFAAPDGAATADASAASVSAAPAPVLAAAAAEEQDVWDEVRDRIVQAFRNRTTLNLSDLQIPYVKEEWTSNSTRLGALIAQVVVEYPEFFWAGEGHGKISYTYRDGYVTILQPIELHFKTDSVTEAMEGEFNDALNDAISWTTGQTDEAQKVKAVHDYLVRKCTYNNDAAESADTSAYWYAWSAYGALVERKPVCEGYVYAFAACMKQLEIECQIAADSGHAWNRVKLGDNWYNVDVTWDDPVYADGTDAGEDATPSTKYFLKSDAKWAELEHISDTSLTPAATDTTYDSDDYEWPAYNASGEAVPRIAFTSGNPRVALSRTLTYTGSAIIPGKDDLSVTMVVDGKETELVLGTDYEITGGDNNVNATTGSSLASFTLKGKGDYEGSVSVSFPIRAADLSQVSVAAIAGQTYTGSEIRPSVVLNYGGQKLVQGRDYTLSYSNNTQVGESARVQITGIGNYSGTLSPTFTIVGKLKAATLSASKYTYSGKAVKPDVTVKGSDGKTLVRGRDYTVGYPSGRKGVGAYKVTIKGKGAYAGTLSRTFTIVAKLKSAKLSASVCKYTGKAKKPGVTVKGADGKKLKLGKSYTVKYAKGCAKPGRYKVTIKGKGLYTGTLMRYFRIVR